MIEYCGRLIDKGHQEVSPRDRRDKFEKTNGKRNVVSWGCSGCVPHSESYFLFCLFTEFWCNQVPH